MRLSPKIVDRVNREFADSDRSGVVRLLESYAHAQEESQEMVLTQVLDRARGDARSVAGLIATATSDPRDLSYSSSRDPYMLIDRLLKNLRSRSTLTDNEVSEANAINKAPGSTADRAFDFICRTINEQRRTISEDQRECLRHIATVLRYPPHSVPWLEEQPAVAKPWWKFW